MKMLISLKDIYSTKKLYNEYILYGCNPLIANDLTIIQFELPEKVKIKLAVYDNIGSEADVLVESELEKGFYEFRLDCSKFSIGSYIIKMSTEKYASSRKMFIVR